MSFNIRNIRELATEPNTKFISHLAKKISDFANAQQTQDLENKEDIYSSGQDVEAVLRFHSLSAAKRFTFDKFFYPPTEPDLLYNTLWLQGHNTGNITRDLSGFNNGNSMNPDGSPGIQLIDGDPFDYGINNYGTLSTALRFNDNGDGTPYTGIDPGHINIDDNTRIRLDGSTSMTWFFRVRPLSTSLHQGKRRTIYCKTDAPGATQLSDIDDAVRFSIDPVNKRLVIQIKRGVGNFFSKETNAQTFVEGNVYDVFVTYNGGTIKCYMAKTGDSVMTDMTLNDSGYGEEWGASLSDASVRLMKRGPGSNDGAFHGDFYDFKIWRNKILVANVIGNSIQFDGSNDSIDCTNDATLWSQSLTKFSYSFWIYPTAIGDGNDRVVVSHGGTSNHAFRTIIDTSVADKIRFLIKDSVGSTKTAFSNGLLLNQWNHVACTYDNSLGSANIKIYVNGVLGGTTANLTEAINLSAVLQLSETSTDFQGYMKDFRFWKNEALSQPQVVLVMDNIPSASTPDYWLTLTEGVGNPTDVVNGVLTATLTNGASWVVNEIGNHWENKWTTANIPFGQVMIANYYSTTPQFTAGYDSDGYDSTGFDTV